MIFNGCMATSGGTGVQPRAAAHGGIYLSCFPRRPATPAASYLKVKSLFGGPPDNSLFFSSRGVANTKPLVVRRGSMARGPDPARASKDVPYSYRYPPMTKKPRWWWRTLACVPYLMPLHETWMYGETAYHLHPFLEDFEFLTYPFLEFIGMLPSWFLMAYFFAAYLGVVRRKEWPHYLRFHVVMGMLLEIVLQVIGTVSKWMPLAVYWGKVGMHFWTAVCFAYLFTVLECLRCAMAGMYADIPFVCDAAYIQIPYD